MFGLSLVRLTIIGLKCICYIGLALTACAYGSTIGINIPEMVIDLLIALQDLPSTNLMIKLLVFTMNCLILFSEFSFNFILFVFSMIYGVIVYIGEIAMKYQNLYCYLLSFIGFSFEIFWQLIMGKGNAINYALSWIVCLCLCLWYLDYKFCRVLNADFTVDELQERDINQRHINRDENFENLDRIPCPEDKFPHNIISEDDQSDKDKIHVCENDQDCWRMLEEEFDSYLTLRMKMMSRLKGRMKRERSTELRDNDHKDLNIQPSTSTSEQNQKINSERHEAQSRNEIEKDENFAQLLCSVCMEEERSVATFPCGHTHVCFTCVTAIMTDTKKCPICSTDIHYYKTVFL